MTVLYVDVDGTLVGPGGILFWDGSTRVAESLVRAARAGITVVPVTGRGRIQVFELCRLLGLRRGIAELGCVHVEGKEVRYELGDFPFRGETPVEAMLARGAVAAACNQLGLAPFEPWNEGRVATYLMRGAIDVEAGNAELARLGFGWCQLLDNGLAYHLAPAGTGKPAGVRADREHHGLAREDTAFVGDSVSDVACAAEVGRAWLVANADPSITTNAFGHAAGGASGHAAGIERTKGRYGDGVAEVVDHLLGLI
ncbi:MAG: HAD family hydrolase [Acidimicrobiales bacterium]